MLLSLTSCLLLGAVPLASDSRVVVPPPLEITFKHSCSLPEGRKQAYDPATGVFHIHFRNPGFAAVNPTCRFEVTRVSGRIARPVVFRLTGTQDSPLAVLWLHVGDKTYELCPQRCDRELFRVERTAEVTTVAFTDKGRALLKPGAFVEYTEFAW